MANDNPQNPWGNNDDDKKKNPSSGGSPWSSQPKPKAPPSGFDKTVPVPDSIRKLFDNLMGGQPDAHKSFFAFALIVLLIWAASGIYQVSATQLGIVMHLGESREVTSPGLHYHLPYPLEDVLLVDVTSARRVTIGHMGEMRNSDESMMLTGDENIVDVSFDVMWQVDPARVKDFMFKIKDPELTVRAVAQSAMREVISQTSIQSAITTGREEIEAQTKEVIQKTLDQYETGILVTIVNLRNAMPPPEVADSFQDVTRARSDKETKINQAQTYRNNIIPVAEGQAAKLLAEADAYKENITNQAKGEAERFNSVLQSYQANRALTERQLYLEAMENVLKGANKVVIDPSLKAPLSVLPLDKIINKSSSDVAKD